MSVPLTYLTVEEYLKAEESSEIRHEYLGGQIFAMSGGSKEHNIITLNIASRLRSHLRGGSCSVFMSDMKVRIELANQNKSIFYYPDVIVTCDSQDQDRFFLNYPCLIVEVLSPSTEVTDRREKLVNYRNLDSLQEYVLVFQDEIKVEVYRKENQEKWSMQTLGKSDNLELNSVGLTLTMPDIYEDVLTV
ncbi:MAG: Uma2 family endonuclease [Chlorogloeopsis fritschii C42_A2020_084]|uniref:Uma2 family endonuclease n=1 Tax=Chlorogloeopsis fritschii TaxID=1124 RepID=UPI0019F57D8D|nr:Uma2 family endonuclease [Chlorogloeopsis fritschii]MBF2007458.1 Uma2 family endonuclease [Chlorogloeopsis fritschii C42_A2020_084]